MDQPKPVRTSIFFYVPLAIAGILLIMYIFVRNYKAGEEAGLQAPPPPEGSRTAGNAPKVDERALAKDTGSAAKGKTLFQVNCASCHGPEGFGNGDRAASLNPKPRNFHQEKFKFGDDIVSIHNTILKGSPGTSMPSFALLPVEDTWAIAHFVYTQIPNPPPITDQQLAQLPEGGGGGGGAASSGASSSAATATTTDTTNKAGGGRIPILFAMERLEENMPEAKGMLAANTNQPGAAIYEQRCASCHGDQGQGAPVQVVSVAPYRYARSGSLLNRNAVWFNNRNEFGKIVVKGLPGHLMPGNATLTRQQIDDLYAYVRSLSPASMPSDSTGKAMKAASAPAKKAEAKKTARQGGQASTRRKPR